MKKLLLFSLFCVCHIFYSNAQEIDLIGIGIHGKTNETLTMSNLNTISKVDVYSNSKGLGAIPPNDGVRFSNGDTPSSSWTQIVDDYYLSGSNDVSVGYYFRSIEKPTNNDIEALITIEDYVHSFYAFIHRSDITSKSKSFISAEQVFMYHNGSEDAYKYDVEINQANSSRDIKLKIPVSELDSGDRMMIIDVIAGPISLRFEENTFNKENSLLINEYLIPDVPGYVNNVEVYIFSPTKDDPSYKGNGDSFFVGGVVVDVDKVFDGCTYTQGYWKNHSSCKTNNNGKGPKRDDTWHNLPGGEAEETIFFKSGQDYCEVFDTNPGKGGKYYILAHQYIAAQLNLYNNADPSSITATYQEATAFLSTYSPETVKGNKSLEAKCVQLGGHLDDFNNGRIGPGHCDDSDQVYVEPVKRKIEKNKVVVYPNPVNDLGKIAFTAKESGNTTVELYNISGQQFGTLFERKVKEGDEVLIEYDSKQLKEGLYFAIIKNGSNVYREKISISR